MAFQDGRLFKPSEAIFLPIMGLYYNEELDLENGHLGVPRLTKERALWVNIRDSSGNEVTSLGGGGTGYVEGATTTPATGTAVLFRDSDDGALKAIPGDANGVSVAAHAMGYNEGTWEPAVSGKVFDLDTGGGTENVVGVSLRTADAGGSLPLGEGANPLQVTSGFFVPKYDEIVLSYTGSDLTGVVYKLAAATVATLTLSYTGSDLTGVTRT
jgi:hypothetical protein